MIPAKPVVAGQPPCVFMDHRFDCPSKMAVSTWRIISDFCAAGSVENLDSLFRHFLKLGSIYRKNTLPNATVCIRLQIVQLLVEYWKTSHSRAFRPVVGTKSQCEGRGFEYRLTLELAYPFMSGSAARMVWNVCMCAFPDKTCPRIARTNTNQQVNQVSYGLTDFSLLG